MVIRFMVVDWWLMVAEFVMVDHGWWQISDWWLLGLWWWLVAGGKSMVGFDMGWVGGWVELVDELVWHNSEWWWWWWCREGLWVQAMDVEMQWNFYFLPICFKIKRNYFCTLCSGAWNCITSSSSSSTTSTTKPSLLILFLLHFCVFFFVFWEERDIKFEQKYLFTHDFNRGGLRKTNGIYLKWVKWHFSNHG